MPEGLQARRNLVLPAIAQGVSTARFASGCDSVDYKLMRADPLVFERGLARVRVDPSSFKGGSARLAIHIIDL